MPIITCCTHALKACIVQRSNLWRLGHEVPPNWWRYLQGWLLDNRRQQRHFVVQSALRRLRVRFSSAQIKVDCLTTTVLHGGSEVLSNVPAAACNNAVYWRLRLTCPPLGCGLSSAQDGNWKVVLMGFSTRHSRQILATYFGIPGMRGVVLGHLIQLTTRRWSADSFAPLPAKCPQHRCL